MNIILNFSTNKSTESLTAKEELAVMPAELAKKLLRMYSESLMATSPDKILRDHINKLKEAPDLMEAIKISLNWVRERELIQNITKENWNAYSTVEMATTTPRSKESHIKGFA